ncbi:MAG: hypothetical protein R2752_02680 [Vicinamibacterales bacterium]
MVRAIAVASGLLLAMPGGRPIEARGQTPAAAQAPAPAQAVLPAAEQIVRRHIEAIGGADAFRKIQSMHLVGRVDMPTQGISGPVDIVAARPDRMRLRTTLEGIGEIDQGFDGTHGWEVNPLVGPSLKDGRELDELKDDAWFDSQLYGSEFVAAMETVGREVFDSHDAYRVRLTLKSGREVFELFDVQTGFVIGSESRRMTSMGVVPTVAMLRDYKTFGAIKQPTTLVQRALGLEQLIHVTTIEFDGVAASAFDPPPAVKALIKAAGVPRHAGGRPAGS